MPEGERSLFRRFLARLTGRGDLEDVTRGVQKVATTQQRQVARLDEQLKALNDLIGQRATAKDANEILHAVRALTMLVQQGGTEEGDPPQVETKLFRALDNLAKGSAPIIVGPWTGEVGFEVLYWVPFVEWFRTRWRIAPERLVLVSRGGVDSWYGIPGAQYVDIFSLISPAAFRERTERDEQREMTALDRDVLDMVAARCSLTEAVHLHPRLMYQTLSKFWKDEAGFGLIDRFMIYRQLPPVDDAIVSRLPSDYVAVRFYFSNCFPDKPRNRDLARAVVDALAQRGHVVVLNSGLRADDHSDYTPESNSRVMNIANDAVPERNLAVQSAVIGRARAFVGTYGGYSYVAPLYGVPSVGFYSQPSFKLHHLHVAQWVLERLGPATVTAVNVAHAHLVHAATAGAASSLERPAGVHI